jgi:uncharacterized protein YrrD
VGGVIDDSYRCSCCRSRGDNRDRRIDSQAPYRPRAACEKEFIAPTECIEGGAMTKALLRGADLIGRPVVDASTGDDVAEVRDVVFDASKGKITGFTLRRPGFLGRRLKEVLPISRVLAVGTDAVMILTPSALTHLTDSSDAALSDSGGAVVGDRVITESGRILGELKDVIVVGGPHPRVVAFEIGGGPPGDGLVPIGAATGLSGSALIVPDEYEQRIKTDLTGLAAELALIDEDRT